MACDERLIEIEVQKSQLTRTRSSLLRSTAGRYSIQSISSVAEADYEEEKPHRPGRRLNHHFLLLPCLLFFYLMRDFPFFANLLVCSALISVASFAARRASSVEWFIGDEDGRRRHQSEKKEEYNWRTVREGVEVYSNGDSYEGEFHCGWCTGSGVSRFFAAKGRHEGDWVDGKYGGHGIETWARGSWYWGQYLKGLRHGFGVYMFYSGDSYFGE